MTRALILVALACSLALVLPGCDYGYDEGEDPAQIDESWGTLEYGLRVDDEAASGDRYEQQGLLPATAGGPLPVGYVQTQNPNTAPNLPVQHPDPKPWKK